MNKELENIIEETAIPEISNVTNFWMIRTKEGFFYNEFVTKEYIALGFNYILAKTDLNGDIIHVELKKNHKWINQTQKAINKCDSFINTMKENDIVVIPNKGLTEITLGIVKEYYEESKYSVEDENNVYYKIKNKDLSVKSIDCPFVKRRKIVPIKQIKDKNINFHLYRTLRNYNGISSLNEHAELILCMIFNAFVYKQNIYISLDINQGNDIGLNDISGLLYGSSLYFENFVDPNKITAKVSACSEGQYMLMIKEGLELLQTYGPGIITGFIVMVTGTLGAVKINKLPDFIKSIILIPSEFRKEKKKEELLEEEIKEKKLKNERLALENQERKLIHEETIKRIEESAKVLNGVSDPLKIVEFTYPGKIKDELSKLQNRTE